jgi:hypothetical protein
MENDLRRWMRLMESGDTETNHDVMPPETPWHELQTGQPAMFYAWRGEGGTSTPLSDRWQAKLGRRYLLGEGIYAAPTKLMAKRFGDPVQCRIVLHNPYVFATANAATFEHFNLIKCQQTHDGIVIREGRAVGNEDIRQVCVFSPYTKQVEINIARPVITTLQPGAKVVVQDQWTNDYARQTYGHLSGFTGTVTSMALGHPNVRIKGKNYFLSRQDVKIVS